MVYDRRIVLILYLNDTLRHISPRSSSWQRKTGGFGCGVSGRPAQPLAARRPGSVPEVTSPKSNDKSDPKRKSVGEDRRNRTERTRNARRDGGVKETGVERVGVARVLVSVEEGVL